MDALLPGMEWPALVAGPVFLCFEISGKPGHKARHRSRIVIPKEAWSYPMGNPNLKPRFMTEAGVKRIFVQQYPDPATAAYEAMIREYAGLLMNRKHVPPTERPVALLVHAFREIPESWSKTDKARALARNILPTPRPDDDNYLKIRDALDGIVWKNDSQCCDSRVLKIYSDRPGLRIEIREMVEP